MSANPNLLSLPEEVVRYISNFLKLPDLLALSATCQRLRSALNCNSVWREYSKGGAIGQALKNVSSIVAPIFADLEDETSTLEPLCEHKLHFLRQTRLFNNYSKGKFIKHSVNRFRYFLSDFETCNFNLFSDRQITYKDQYLFALGYCDDMLFEEVKVYNIKEAPCLLVTFKLIKHENDPNYSVVIWLKVVENKLVVRQDNWFDVYEINLPDLHFPLLHSIDVRISPSVDDSSLFLVRDFILVENHSSYSSNIVHMWNVSSGTRLDDINPKIEGSDFKICNYPGIRQDILFSVEVSIGGGSFITPHLFVYSLNTLQYTDFYAVLPFKSVPTNPLNYFGLMDSHHVVLLHDRQEFTVDVFVYDRKLSALLVQKSVELMNKTDSCIVNGFLALRKKSTLEIVNISNLETIWKINFEAPIEAYESFLNIHCIDMLSLYHMILVKTSASIEVWNLENRKKCFDLSKSIWFIVMSDSYSKLIVLEDATLQTFIFW